MTAIPPPSIDQSAAHLSLVIRKRDKVHSSMATDQTNLLQKEGPHNALGARPKVFKLHSAVSHGAGATALLGEHLLPRPLLVSILLITS